MSKVIRKISEDTYQKMARTVHSLLEEERGTAETPKLDKLWDNGWDMRAGHLLICVLADFPDYFRHRHFLSFAYVTDLIIPYR